MTKMEKIAKRVKLIEAPLDVPPLDRWRADEMLEPNRPVWGLTSIAKVIGLSVDKTRALAREPGVPIYQPEGCSQYFAWRSELLAWLKKKP